MKVKKVLFFSNLNIIYPPSDVKPHKLKTHTLLQPLRFQIIFDNGSYWSSVIPQDFNTDLASYQWWFYWMVGWILPRKERVAHASVLHDYLRRSRALEKEFGLTPFRADILSSQVYEKAQKTVPSWQAELGKWGSYIGDIGRNIQRELGYYKNVHSTP